MLFNSSQSQVELELEMKLKLELVLELEPFWFAPTQVYVLQNVRVESVPRTKILIFVCLQLKFDIGGSGPNSSLFDVFRQANLLT